MHLVITLVVLQEQPVRNLVQYGVKQRVCKGRATLLLLITVHSIEPIFIPKKRSNSLIFNTNNNVFITFCIGN